MMPFIPLPAHLPSSTLSLQLQRKDAFLLTHLTRDVCHPVLVSSYCTHAHHMLPCTEFQSPSPCTEQASGIFGQPIDKIATDQMQGRPSSGSGSSAGTPMSAGSRIGSGVSLQPPSSPTSTDTCFMETEPNPTAILLEALSKTDKATAPPSPKTQRQLALRPSEPRVPPIVRKAIEYLDQTAVKTEGLFRISGSKARIHEVSSTPGRVFA